MSYDEAVLYDRLTRHVARCADCATGYCDAASALLQAWGDAAKLADRQAAEADAAMGFERGESETTDCAEDTHFAREAEREAFE